jgi:hypothetical protein
MANQSIKISLKKKSAVQLAKEGQGYRAECPRCGNCANYSSDILEKKDEIGSYTVETNKRCRIGKFAIGKNGWCLSHVFKIVG